MFKQNQEAINKVYRNEQERRAARERLAQSVKTTGDDEINKLLRYVRNTNLGSVLIFILAIVTFAMYFIFSSASIKAQEMTNLNGEYEPMDNNVEILYLRVAVEKVQEGDYESAISYFDAIIDRMPEFAPAYTGRAYALFLTGEYELALEDANVAFELNPDDGAVQFVLAEIHFSMKSYDNANSYYEAYQTWLDTFKGEPVLLWAMLGESSLDLLNEHWAASIAGAEVEKIS